MDLIKFSPLKAEQGFCKAPGIAWNNEEAYAVNNLNIPADYVRKGILTKEEYEKVKFDWIEKINNEDEKIETIETPVEEVNEQENSLEWEEIDLETVDIEKLREIYTETTGKKLVGRYRNDREWILNKLSE